MHWRLRLAWALPLCHRKDVEPRGCTGEATTLPFFNTLHLEMLISLTHLIYFLFANSLPLGKVVGVWEKFVIFAEFDK